jgi:hypothetical protein
MYYIYLRLESIIMTTTLLSLRSTSMHSKGSSLRYLAVLGRDLKWLEQAADPMTLFQGPSLRTAFAYRLDGIYYLRIPMLGYSNCAELPLFRVGRLS